MLRSKLRCGRRALAFGAVMSLSLAAAGCGASAAKRDTDPPSVVHHRHAARTRSTATSTSPATASSTTQSTTTNSTSTADLPGTGKPTVTIGDKNYTEQFVLGQLYLQALEAQGYSVNINQNIGPTGVTLQGLKSGALAMYPEYLNVLNSSIAHSHRPHATAQDAFEAAQRYAGEHGLELLEMTPFSDTYGIAVTDSYGDLHRLRSIQDLGRVAPSLTIGGAAQFEQAPAGLRRLQRVYGVKPAAFKPMAVGDQYNGLDDGTIQAAYVNTTDGELETGDYRLLRDPKHIFGFGNVVPVVSEQAVSAEGPAFVDTINQVDALLTTQTMRRLNLLASVGGQSPADVARQFLQTHGLIPASSP